MRRGADRDDACLAAFAGTTGQGVMQSEAQGEVAKVIGGELQFPAFHGSKQRARNDRRVVDQQVQWAFPALDKGVYRGLIGEVQGGDAHALIPGRGHNVLGAPRASVGIADRERDVRARTGECASGLKADAGRAAGDDGTTAAEIDAGDDLGGSGLRAERGGDAVVVPCCLFPARSSWHACGRFPCGRAAQRKNAPYTCKRREIRSAQYKRTRLRMTSGERHIAPLRCPWSGENVVPEKIRPLRADAQLNHDRLLDAAARAFARDGSGASLKAIAKDAGVGIGTLYRRFPTRERLTEATYRNETAKLCAAAPALLETLPATEALRAWMDRIVDYMATKHGMADALRTVLVTDGELRMQTRDLLTGALATLLAAGVAAETIRPDLDPTDVLMGLGGVMLIAGAPDQHDQARRLLDLLMDGLKYRSDRR